MRIFSPTSLLVALCLGASAHSSSAQSTVYGAVSLVNYGYVPPNGGSFVYKLDTVGFTGGVTYLFPSSSRLKAGVDARFDGSPGIRGGEAGMLSFRVAFVPHRIRLSPYFQIGGGFVSVPAAGNYTCVGGLSAQSCSYATNTRITGGAVDFGGGLNVRLSDHIVLRPVELMGEASTRVGHASFGAAIGYEFGERSRY